MRERRLSTHHLAAFACISIAVVAASAGCSGDSSFGDSAAAGAGMSTGAGSSSFGCEAVSDGCHCSTTIAPNGVACSAFSLGGGSCCAETGWPASGSCECKPSKPVACATNKSTSDCRCAVGVTPTSAESSTTECDAGGNWTCCSGSSVCHCAYNLSCASGETSVQKCGGLVAPHCTSGSEVATCSANGQSKCADKGYCGPTTDACNCGLSCIHLGEGSYTCGDSCSFDSECTGKTDPQSGKPYNHCSVATLGGFCS